MNEISVTVASMTGACRPAACVGALCLRAGEIALIRRGRPPNLGEWAIPGGRIERGETWAAAAVRELAEETALDAEVLGLLDVVDLIAPATPADPGYHFVVVEVVLRWRAGEPTAGDDAAEAVFLPRDAAIARLPWPSARAVVAHAFTRYGEACG